MPRGIYGLVERLPNIDCLVSIEGLKVCGTDSIVVATPVLADVGKADGTRGVDKSILFDADDGT